MLSATIRRTVRWLTWRGRGSWKVADRPTSRGRLARLLVAWRDE
jgi:hypothetical protein